MTQQLIGPDGTIHEFPDEATPQMIARAMGVREPTDQEIAAAQEQAQPRGNFGTNLVDSLTMGAGKYLAPGVTMEAGGSAEDVAGASEAYSKDVAGYKRYNPAGAALASAVGTLPGTLTGLGIAGIGERAALSGAPRIAQFVAGESGGPLALPSLATAGAKVGAESALLQHGTSDQTLGQDVATGAETGAVAGAAAPIVRGLVPKPTVNPLVANTVPEAQGLGVNLTLPQIAQGRIIKALGENQEQSGPFTRALSHTMGGDTDALTQSNFAGIRADIGKEFDAVVPKLQINPWDGQLHTDLNDIRTQIRVNSGTAPGDPISDPAYRRMDGVVGNLEDELIHNAISGTTIPGQRYHELIKTGGPLDSLMKNQELKPMAIQLRSAVDDAAERASPPDAIQDFQTARQHWKNAVAIEPLVENAQPHGLIDPTQVKSAVKNAYDSYGWRDPGDIGTLGEAGQYLPKVTNEGGEKAPAGHGVGFPLKVATGTGLAFAAAEHAGEIGPYVMEHPVGAAATGIGLGALAAGKAGLQAIANSDWYRNYVLNQLTNPSRGPINMLISPSVSAMNQRG